MIRKTLIGVGVNQNSDSVLITNTFIRDTGNPNNGGADPTIWINDSSNVEVNWGEMRGDGNGPGTDGEVSCYDSNNVSVYGTHVIDSGASGFYFVNCDNSSIENAEIDRAGEWGIDIVGGSDNFLAKDNYVGWSNFGGAVFYEYNSIGGTFTNNTFDRNRQLGVGNCNGINVRYI